MFNFFKKSKEKKQEQVVENIKHVVEDNLEDIVGPMVEKYIQENIGKFLQTFRIAYQKDKKESDTPWVEIVSDFYDEETQSYKLSLDWNAAFITQLKKSGYRANTEEDLIQIWLASLVKSNETRVME
jgi:hypothetical protein